jgi:phosphatidylserine/phosphatidylglycerophosphate/cardiolipin synthase-like enzyme
LIIIDGETVITGSHNYTQSAFCANYELSVILIGMPEKNGFLDFFNGLWNGQEVITNIGYTGERFKFIHKIN